RAPPRGEPMIWLLALLACGPRAGQPTAADPHQVAAPDCMAACLARARGEGDRPGREERCREECEAELPLVLGEDDLTVSDETRVVVEGRIVRRDSEGSEVTVLELDDGAEVVVSYGAPPHGWEGLTGRAVRVEGTFWRRAPG